MKESIKNIIRLVTGRRLGSQSFAVIIRNYRLSEVHQVDIMISNIRLKRGFNNDGVIMNFPWLVSTRGDLRYHDTDQSYNPSSLWRNSYRKMNYENRRTIQILLTDTMDTLIRALDNDPKAEKWILKRIKSNEGWLDDSDLRTITDMFIY